MFKDYYETVTRIKTLSQASLQQLVSVYENLIEELKPRGTGPDPNERRELFDFMAQYAAKAGPGVLMPDFADIARVLYGGKEV